MGMRGACALWTLMPRRRPDMTAGVKPTRFFPTRRAIAACCSLTGLVGAALLRFSGMESVPFAIGLGILGYAAIVLLYTGLSLWRLRHRMG